jgi:hypothetical protein
MRVSTLVSNPASPSVIYDHHRLRGRLVQPVPEVSGNRQRTGERPAFRMASCAAPVVETPVVPCAR